MKETTLNVNVTRINIHISTIFTQGGDQIDESGNMGRLETLVLEIESKVVYSTAHSRRYVFVNSQRILLNELIQS